MIRDGRKLKLSPKVASTIGSVGRYVDGETYGSNHHRFWQCKTLLKNDPNPEIPKGFSFWYEDDIWKWYRKEIPLRCHFRTNCGVGVHRNHRDGSRSYRLFWSESGRVYTTRRLIKQ